MYDLLRIGPLYPVRPVKLKVRVEGFEFNVRRNKGLNDYNNTNNEILTGINIQKFLNLGQS